MSTERRTLLRRCALVVGLLATGWVARGMVDATDGPEIRRVADAARSPSAGFEIELFARTAARPAASTLCLLDGSYGMTEKDGQVLNRNSHVDFEHDQPGCLSVGIQGGDRGQVIDLGDEAELAAAVNGPPLQALRWRDECVVAEGDELMAPDPVGAPEAFQKVRRWLSTLLSAPRSPQTPPQCGAHRSSRATCTSCGSRRAETRRRSSRSCS
jgi:hypothetical protein